MSKPVTCILTSCGRHDLLRITIDSFLKFNTYDIAEFYVYEDSDNGVSLEIKKLYPFIKWIEPAERLGQIAALDYLWHLVKTPYAFTMEDDWEFLKEGFIEKSINILTCNPNILQVWLRGLEETNKHPVEWVGWDGDFGILKSQPNIWAGTNFSPSLKRKSDYDLIAPFSKHTTWNSARPYKSEADISKVYHSLGFKGAILQDIYIKHIGAERHIT